MKTKGLKVTHLFIKKETNSEMVPVNSLVVKNLHLLGQKKSQPFRNVLITSKSLLEFWKIKPGQFRENIVIDDLDLSELRSGDEVQIGEMVVRITFNCEPCGKVAYIAAANKLKGKRGVLGDFMKDGFVGVGDEVKVLKKEKYEPIPADYLERIAWYLKNFVKKDIMAKELLWNCGVAPGLIRVLPVILVKYNIYGKDKVKYKKNASNVGLLSKF